MLRVMLERSRQGYRTGKFPRQEPTLPARFRGLPQINGAPAAGVDCEGLCPFGACQVRDGELAVDLGLCLFCADCKVCGGGHFEFTREYRLAARTRQDLLCGPEGITLAGLSGKSAQ